MPRRTTILDLALPAHNANTPVWRWLYAVLRMEILGGRLRPGARLPATRDLANQYGLSRGTIVSAFEQLKSEGYVEGSVGSGTYVSSVLPDALLQAAPPEVARSAAQRQSRRRFADFGRHVRAFPIFEDRPIRPFRANLPALELFPSALWAGIASRRLRAITTR